MREKPIIPPSPTSGPSRVALVVDDNAPFREVLSRILEQSGWHTQRANSGREALETLRHQTFNVILMDVKMPDMSGIETAQGLRSIGDNTPVVFTTAYPDYMIGDLRGVDPAMVLRKPFTSEELLAALAELDLCPDTTQKEGPEAPQG